MPSDKVRIKYCRHCGRLIALDSVDCPYCGKKTIRIHEEAICPVCRERIKAGAKKCRHCGEFLDGRDTAPPPAPPPAQQIPAPIELPQQQVIYIEKAIVAGADENGQLRLQRPDGTTLLPGDVETQKALPGQAQKGLPAPEGTTALVPAEPGTQPPPRDTALAVVDTALAKRPDTTPAKLKKKKAPKPPKPPRKKKEKKPRDKKEPEATGPVVTPPPVLVKCAGCNYEVYNTDNFCENCGRDLSLHARESEYRPTKRHGLVDLALIGGFGGPAGLLMPAPLCYIPALAGALCGSAVLARVWTSHGEFKGARPAIAGLLAAVFWLLAIAVLVR
jgi:Double zinc ribbon